MSRKGENIHKRKDGRWEARITIMNNEGCKKKKSLYGKTYKEAKEKMLNARKECLDITIAKGKNRKRLSDAAYEWLSVNQMKQKPSTQLRYQMIVEKHILPEFGNKNVEDIEETAINLFLIRKLNNGNLENGKGLSASYVKSIRIVLNSILKYSAGRGYCKPLRTEILKPCEEKKEPEVMEVNDQIKLEHMLAVEKTPVSIGIMIALHTGLRLGEICALKWGDIDFDKGIIHVCHTVARVKNDDFHSALKTKLIIDIPKTKSSKRDVPINSKLMGYLQSVKRENPSCYITSDFEDFLSPRTFEYRFHKMLEWSEIKNVNFHVLRHTFATRCVEVGMDAKTLSEILGHSNVGITLNTYVHSSIDMKRRQIEKLVLNAV